MIINTQQLRTMFDELKTRVKTLEAEMAYLKKGEVPPAPEPPPAPPPEPPVPKPKREARFWGSGPGQYDGGTSRRWRNR